MRNLNRTSLGSRRREKRPVGVAGRSSASRAATIQRSVGNRATALLVSRQVSAAAEELEDAMSGWGTDEAAIYRVLALYPGSTALRTKYQELTGRSLLGDLRDDLSGSELDRALRLYYGHTGAAWDAAVRVKNAIAGAGTDEDTIFEVLRSRTTTADRASLQAAYRDATGNTLEADLRSDMSGDELREALIAMRQGPLTPILSEARQLRDAMAGLGTGEAAVFRVLGRHPADAEALIAAYHELTGRSLDDDLRGDLSGSDLERALGLLHPSGTFTNEVSQDMFEGATTVVRGRFEWRFEAGEMKVDVKVNFQPAEGVDAPVSTWQSQIDNVWNQYALTEPGGLNIPITMSLVEASDGKTIRVVENETPGTYGGSDRANAGKWYPVMRDSTAPHEFGHLIGLQDEYQRKHPDFVDITGGAPTGPENTSGKSNREIADELNTALTGDDEARRAADATAVLDGVGLISGGHAQQGDFAQAVMAAYDDAYSPSLQDTLEGLPRSGRWMLQSVFSFASGTIMGNPGVVPHEHPVAPRHLREFVNIAQHRFPSYGWSTGPR